MAPEIQQRSWEAALALAATQHAVVTHRQLIAVVTADAIRNWVERGRLHRVHQGVYAVGRPQLSPDGHLNAAVLACGDGAALSHLSAGTLWRLGNFCRPIEVTVRRSSALRRPGIRVHRRPAVPATDFDVERGIQVTGITRTLIDLAARLDPDRLERAVNDADKLGLIDPERLLAELDQTVRTPGTGIVRALLAKRSFRLTDSALERLFLPIAKRAGLPDPLTRHLVNGCRVDFYWPDLGLVIETDGLRYHRTPSTQSRDARRDQIHIAAGLIAVRFTHQQVRYRSAEVELTLRRIVATRTQRH